MILIGIQLVIVQGLFMLCTDNDSAFDLRINETHSIHFICYHSTTLITNNQEYQMFMYTTIIATTFYYTCISYLSVLSGVDVLATPLVLLLILVQPVLHDNLK